MDKTSLVKAVANLFELTGHRVQTSVKINHREIDVVAEELNTLLRKTVLIECADYSSLLVWTSCKETFRNCVRRRRPCVIAR